MRHEYRMEWDGYEIHFDLRYQDADPPTGRRTGYWEPTFVRAYLDGEEVLDLPLSIIRSAEEHILDDLRNVGPRDIG